MAKHARPRRNKENEKEGATDRTERRERTMLVIRIAVLLIAIARSLSGS
ncbi:hypothetical protein ACIBU0_02550 [Streptomyces sp. NPDC049627]